MRSWQDPSKDGNGYLPTVAKKTTAVTRALRRAVDAMVRLNCSFAERERATMEIGNKAERHPLEEELQSIAEAHGKDLLNNGRLYREFRPGSHQYASLCGPLGLSRATYREVGVRNGPTVAPPMSR